jgi:peptide/nickel transport system ATP-binding protein
MTGIPAIEVRDLGKTFAVSTGLFKPPRRVTAVEGVSFSVPHGGVMGIVGESGCGKSTLARMIMGLLPVTSGEVLVDGRRLAEMDRRERARLIQPVPQDPFSSLNPRRRVRDNIALPLTAQGNILARDASETVSAMMAKVGLRPDMGDRYPAELSGGQRQRVAIARALVLRPRILICDEPTSALDVSVQAQILNMLVELRRDLGLTMVFISHNLAVVEHMASEVAVMYLGRVVERSGAATLFRQPGHPYTQALLSSVLTPEPGLGIPDIGLGDAIPDPSAVPPGCRFHPRCSFVQDICKTAAPPRLSTDSMVECHFAGQLPAVPEPATMPR